MKVKRWIKRVGLVLLAMAIILPLLSAANNRRLPTGSAVVDRLGSLEKARLSEFVRLRRQLGDAAWPGFGDGEIPLVVYNERYAFLLGYPDPPAGWVKVPQGEHRGGPWEAVPDDTWDGATYYRQRLPASGETPEAFTVRVGDRWAASMPTMGWMALSLQQEVRAQLPPFLADVFPYPLLSGLFIRGSEGYLSLLAHEAFHAYQGRLAPERLAAAENVVAKAAAYPRDNPDFQAAWQRELDLLAAALEADDDAAAADLAGQFLAARETRRRSAALDTSLVNYERQREWLEGLGRYVELTLWREASRAPDFAAGAHIGADPDFTAYAGYDRRWSQELDQIGRMAGDEGDGRFYYSGMAQAMLLDRLAPGWHAGAMADGVFLEDLLATAEAEPAP